MGKKIVIVFVFLLASFGVVNAQKGIKNVDAAEFKSLMEKKKGVLIDLRTPDEITKKGKIKGAEEIDFLAPDAESKIDLLDKKKTYYIYCAGGGRSGDCAEVMIKKGFKNVVNLQKGFSDWKKAGYEIETK